MDYYALAVAANPALTRAWAQLAWIDHELGRPDAARARLDDALTHNPGDFSLLMAAGDLLGAMNDGAAAEAMYRRAADVAPQRVEGWVRLAQLAEARGDARAAAPLWQRALAIDRDHAFIPGPVRARAAR
jgi:tetratricopeptide (TPR) repeat protein